MTPETTKDNPLLKLALEMGPLALFFITNAYGDRLFGVAADKRIFAATAVFMAAGLLALLLARRLTGEWPVMLLVSTVIVTFFGTLTLFLQDETFIKLKPTIANTLFGVILATGLLLKRNLLALVMGSVFDLTEEGWRQLTIRWIAFFFFLALVNEIVWRTQSTDFWVAFKVWGIMPLTLVFGMLQVPLIVKHGKGDGA